MIRVWEKEGIDFVVNGHPRRHLPHILNVSFPGMETEILLMNLDLEGIACSSGSACTSGTLEVLPRAEGDESAGRGASIGGSVQLRTRKHRGGSDPGGGNDGPACAPAHGTDGRLMQGRAAAVPSSGEEAAARPFVFCRYPEAWAAISGRMYVPFPLY